MKTPTKLPTIEKARNAARPSHASSRISVTTSGGCATPTSAAWGSTSAAAWWITRPDLLDLVA